MSTCSSRTARGSRSSTRAATTSTARGAAGESCGAVRLPDRHCRLHRRRRHLRLHGGGLQQLLQLPRAEVRVRRRLGRRPGAAPASARASSTPRGGGHGFRGRRLDARGGQREPGAGNGNRRRQPVHVLARRGWPPAVDRGRHSWVRVRRQVAPSLRGRWAGREVHGRGGPRRGGELLVHAARRERPSVRERVRHRRRRRPRLRGGRGAVSRLARPDPLRRPGGCDDQRRRAVHERCERGAEDHAPGRRNGNSNRHLRGGFATAATVPPGPPGLYPWTLDSSGSLLACPRPCTCASQARRAPPPKDSHRRHRARPDHADGDPGDDHRRR